MSNLSYAERAALCSNATAKKLLNLMQEKQTNLSVSADLITKADLLKLAAAIGPEICVLKTHIDIVQDFDQELVHELTKLAEQHQFLIFEDRKFADIGNTVRLQYSEGIYRIADWGHITNAHPIFGPGIIEGLKKVGLPKGNALLLLAELSSKGNLIDQQYTQAAIDMALAHKDFVMGFVAQHRLTTNPTMIHFTPGIHMGVEKDGLGQQYISPENAFLVRDTDVIIVGRGIYEAADSQTAAREYREAGWQAYNKKLSKDFSSGSR